MTTSLLRASVPRPAGAWRATLVATMLILLACSQRSQESPSVVLVTVDTLAAGHLSGYGYPRETSPHLDEFAKHASLYEHAFATSPWTLPSHASVMTGKYPFEHGAHVFKVGSGGVAVFPLAASHETLAETLRLSGYATAGFVSNPVFLSPRYNLDQGFEVYESERVDGAELNRRALRWLDEAAPERFFLFLNYMDTHNPYDASPPSARPDFLDHVTDRSSLGLLSELMPRVLTKERPAPRAELDLLEDLYDIAVANVDEHLGALFSQLRARGLYDSSLIVVTSDHGEYFGEHDLLEHGMDVYQEVLWVPLIVKAPGQRVGRRLEHQVSSAQLPGIIFSHFPAELLEGLDAVFRWDEEAEIVVSQNYYTYPWHYEKPERRRRSDRIRTVAYAWPYKYIHSSDGRHELYDLGADPGEGSNLVAIRPGLVRIFAERLERLQRERGESARPEGHAPTLTPEERDQLKALGYL